MIRYEPYALPELLLRPVPCAMRVVSKQTRARRYSVFPIFAGADGLGVRADLRL